MVGERRESLMLSWMLRLKSESSVQLHVPSTLGEAMDEEQEAELEESAASARLTSNAGSNAGVAVGPLRFARPRSRGRGTRDSEHT